MINIIDKADCCGCTACVQKCPKKCIELNEDNEGFLYPKVDLSRCIECNLCEQVCPVINRADPSIPIKVLAVKNRDLEERELSSSGGIFIALAEAILKRDGIVFGCVFDNNWEPHHVSATTIDEVLPMLRSKYAQSRIENTYSEAEKYLKGGRLVMFVGTSCQIAGLKLYLRKEYENLLTIDLICHGVPSPGIWRKYLKELRIDKNLISEISFREKNRSGYDWINFGFVIWDKNGTRDDIIWSKPFREDPYMRGFLHNLSLRPSCYSCPAKGGKSMSDITIADYWGIENIMPDFYDKSGVGVAILQSKKGLEIIEECNLDYKESNLQDMLIKNQSYLSSVKKPINRELFFSELSKGSTISIAVKKCLSVSLTKRVKKKLHSLLNYLKSK